MKKFIKGKWFPVIVAIAILVLAAGVVLTMVLFGWRFTYAPELENSWVAISAVAAWAGAIGTVAAVFSAIHVANQQNKIALFEKRYKVFQLYDSCKIFSELLQSLKGKNGLNSNDIQVLFLAVFCGIPMGEKINDFRFLHTQYIMMLEQLKQSQFLFEKEIELYLQIIAGALQRLIKSICHSAPESELESVVQSFIVLFQDENSEIMLKKMMNKLTLQ